MLEKEMYPLIKQFFTSRGFDVRAEVLDCDVVARKDDHMIAVEMKTQLGIRLLAQAAQRQKAFDLVYIAIPKPSYKKRFSKHYKQTLHLVRRLELGLLYVDVNGDGVCTEEFAPQPFDRNRSIAANSSQKKRVDALEEFLSRSEDYNIGGTTGIKQMTAYRENALLIALYLMRDGPMSAMQLKKLDCGEKAYQILYHNHYGWFERVDKGIYDVTTKGKKAVKKYKNVCENLKKIMQ